MWFTHLLSALVQSCGTGGCIAKNYWLQIVLGVYNYFNSFCLLEILEISTKASKTLQPTRLYGLAPNKIEAVLLKASKTLRRCNRQGCTGL
jgi:hypothetical protein